MIRLWTLAGEKWLEYMFLIFVAQLVFYLDHRPVRTRLMHVTKLKRI